MSEFSGTGRVSMIAAHDAAPALVPDDLASNESMAMPAERRAPWMLYTDRQRWGFLAVLFLVSTSNYLDRNLISVLLEPIKHEFQASDTMLGLLGGLCFALFYAAFGIPVARWADRGNRRTLITFALAVWSVMTALCGLATTFWQLALARVGVGAGESGAIPPAQSLIADYFPPQRRAIAIAVFTGAATAGYALGFGLGGYIAANHGWRTAFLVAGVPGLALALFTRVALAEPRLQLGFPANATYGESIREALGRLGAKRSFRYALVGCILYFFVAYGALIFIPSFLIRLLHVPLGQVSVAFGAVGMLATVLGTLGGGWLGDRLHRRDTRWLAWLPAIACGFAAAAYAAAFWVAHFPLFLALSFVAGVLLAGGLPPIFSAIHCVCGNRRRATAIAAVLFSSTLLGGGFGPLVTGALSDQLSAVYAAEGLRYALTLITLLLVAAAGFFYFSGRAMPSDLED